MADKIVFTSEIKKVTTKLNKEGMLSFDLAFQNVNIGENLKQAVVDIFKIQDQEVIVTIQTKQIELPFNLPLNE